MKTVSKSGKVTFGESSRTAVVSLQSSESIGPPAASSTMINKNACPASIKNRPKKPAFTIPALSIPPKTPPLDPVLEKLKRKTIRRNAPEGEDLTKIREIIRGIKGEVVTVQEFVGMISAYTGDNGNILCTVMAEDLSQFRRMAKRVYETMTQDVSDVLANEQIHLTDYYNERIGIFKERLSLALRQIYGYVPDFNFQLYYKDPEGYLEKLFPLPSAAVTIDAEEEDLQRRQTTYHRLQWLRSEGIRLGEENAQLQARLKDLKAQQKQEQIEAKRREELAEIHKSELEETEAELQDKLQDLNESVGQSLVDVEEDMRLKDESKVKKSGSKTRRLGKAGSHQVKKPPPEEPWNVKAAKSIENTLCRESADATMASESAVSISSRKSLAKRAAKAKSKKQTSRPEWQSVLSTTPPSETEKSTRQTSPFHYSPPKSPCAGPCQGKSQSERSGGGTETIRVETHKTVTEQSSESKFTVRPRRNLAPTDTWGF